MCLLYRVGHTDESFQDDKFRKHLLQAILWAAGEDELDYSKAITIQVPEETRFVKMFFLQDLMNPQNWR